MGQSTCGVWPPRKSWGAGTPAAILVAPQRRPRPRPSRRGVLLPAITCGQDGIMVAHAAASGMVTRFGAAIKRRRRDEVRVEGLSRTPSETPTLYNGIRLRG